jgi:hypothetical protein
MRTVICTLAIFLAVGAARAADDRSKPDPDRLKGMKAAVSDVEKGLLKLIVPPTPAPVWELEYHELLKRECGVEVTTAGFGPAEGGAKADKGYDDVKLAEIEHRFGVGILEKLQKRADASLKEGGQKDELPHGARLFVHPETLTPSPTSLSASSGVIGSSAISVTRATFSRAVRLGMRL